MYTKAVTISQLILVTGTFFVTAIVLVNPLQASAQRHDQQNENRPKPSAQQNNPAPKAVSYVYVAQPGDSYSQMARKAVQTYGKKYKTQLSLGQILYSETNMTQQAASPYLALGQQITIQESTVKSWVDKALKLDAATIALWNYYIPGVQFNTDNVGEQ